MTPLTLLVIRHAEKPDEAWPGPGFTGNGIEDDKSLVIRGWQRAGAWAALFGAGLGGGDYPRPDMIYAAQPGGPGQEKHGPSRRPAETVSALALRLGLALKTAFALGQEADLMAEVNGLSGVVLISWEHHAIVREIVPRIPVDHGSPPTKWPKDRFDVVLRFDRVEGANTFAFQPLYPRLLSGDSETALDG